MIIPKSYHICIQGADNERRMTYFLPRAPKAFEEFLKDYVLLNIKNANIDAAHIFQTGKTINVNIKTIKDIGSENYTLSFLVYPEEYEESVWRDGLLKASVSEQLTLCIKRSIKTITSTAKISIHFDTPGENNFVNTLLMPIRIRFK